MRRLGRALRRPVLPPAVPPTVARTAARRCGTLARAGSESPPLVAVGISGGVDSAIAAQLLVEQGYRVVGLHVRSWDEVRPTAALPGCTGRGLTPVAVAPAGRDRRVRGRGRPARRAGRVPPPRYPAARREGGPAPAGAPSVLSVGGAGRWTWSTSTGWTCLSPSSRGSSPASPPTPTYHATSTSNSARCGSTPSSGLVRTCWRPATTRASSTLGRRRWMPATSSWPGLRTRPRTRATSWPP